MKIKCVDNYGCGYLTVGKVYDMELGDLHKIVPSGSIVDDVGDNISILINYSGHGKFEVVEE